MVTDDTVRELTLGFLLDFIPQRQEEGYHNFTDTGLVVVVQVATRTTATAPPMGALDFAGARERCLMESLGRRSSEGKSPSGWGAPPKGVVITIGSL